MLQLDAREARALVAGLIVLAALGAFVAARLKVSADITRLLPGGEVDADALLAKELTTGEPSRTLLLVVDAADTEAAVAASRDFEAALRAEPRVAEALEFLEGGPPAGLEDALWRLYEPRRLAFLASDAAQVPGLLTDGALRAAAADLKRRLALPLSGLVSRVAPADPLLVLPRLFERLAGARAEGLRLAGGRFVTRDGRGAVLFLGTRAAAFDPEAARPLLAGVRAAFERVDAELGGGLRLSQAGVHRYSIRAEDRMRADVGRVSTWSFVGILPLLLLLFRSVRLALLTFPIVLAGSLAGTAACLLLFGSVHGLTLAFGAALIGVTVDFPVHFYCHHVLAPDPRGPRATLRGIWTGLALGALTTVVGFIAMIASSFPGLREVAVFGAVGIAASLVATQALLPALVPRVAAPTPAGRRIVGALARVLAALEARRGPLALATAAVVAGSVALLPRVRWNDDVAALNRFDAELAAEDDAVRERVARYEQRRFVVAVGTDEEAALAANDRVAAALQAADAAGEVSGFRSLATLLPSAATQRAVDAAVRAEPALADRLDAALAEQGFVTAAFAPFREALAAPPPAPLTWSDLVSSPLAALARPFRVTLPDGVGLLSFVGEIADPDALQARLAAVPGARLLDVGAILTRAYAAYRARMLSLLLLGTAAVVALVALRHRALRPTLAATVPALLAVLGTVAALVLLDVELNVLSLVALLMVVSMGDDFGIFLAEAGTDAAALDAVHLAVLLSGVTTAFSFGLLALSEDPALRGIGLTAAIGVSLCLLFALAISALVRGRRGPTA